MSESNLTKNEVTVHIEISKDDNVKYESDRK